MTDGLRERAVSGTDGAARCAGVFRYGDASALVAGREGVTAVFPVENGSAGEPACAVCRDDSAGSGTDRVAVADGVRPDCRTGRPAGFGSVRAVGVGREDGGKVRGLFPFFPAPAVFSGFPVTGVPSFGKRGAGRSGRGRGMPVGMSRFSLFTGSQEGSGSVEESGSGGVGRFFRGGREEKTRGNGWEKRR